MTPPTPPQPPPPPSPPEPPARSPSGVGDPRPGWQRLLEEQLLAKLAGPVELSGSVAERFGGPERWQVEAWDMTFLLLPLNGTWLVLDRVHDDWKPTGLRAGQGAFVWGDRGPEVVHQPTGTAAQRAVLEAHRSRVLEQLEEVAR